jgi:hypothetical protein
MAHTVTHTAAAGTTEAQYQAAAHHSVSIDPAVIKLDDMGTPDDNTDLNVSSTSHGLTPKRDGSTSHFLRGDGTWATPAGAGGGIMAGWLAAADATAAETDMAEWAADGTNDETDINSGEAAGSVYLSSGTFNLNAATLLNTGNPVVGRGSGNRDLALCKLNITSTSYGITIQNASTARRISSLRGVFIRTPQNFATRALTVKSIGTYPETRHVYFSSAPLLDDVLIASYQGMEDEGLQDMTASSVGLYITSYGGFCSHVFGTVGVGGYEKGMYIYCNQDDGVTDDSVYINGNHFQSIWLNENKYPMTLYCNKESGSGVEITANRFDWVQMQACPVGNTVTGITMTAGFALAIRGNDFANVCAWDWGAASGDIISLSSNCYENHFYGPFNPDLCTNSGGASNILGGWET